MKNIVIIFAHPKFQHSRVNRALIQAASQIPNVTIRDLYEHYPDFCVDVEAEKEALLAADIILLQHPLQWYSCPSLMKEWIDVVLERGWAYGPGGTALAGKQWLHAISTGGPAESYTREGSNAFSISELLRPFEQTALLCGMQYGAPFLVHDAVRLDISEINKKANEYRIFLNQLAT